LANLKDEEATNENLARVQLNNTKNGMKKR